MVLLVKVLKKVLVLKFLLMEINIKVSIKMGNLMEKGSIYGLMGLAIKVSLFRVLGKDKVAGNLPKIMEISILVHIRLIRKMAMVGMYGPMDVSTKVDLLMMLSNFLVM
jgi:hypothetical protein